MRRLILSVALLTAACSGGSPTAPSASAGTPPASSYTLTGHITAVQDGSALGNVSINGTPDDASGAFSLDLSAGTEAVNLSGPGILSRRLWVNLTGPRTLDLHPIALAGFDLTFYREIARGSLDNSSLQPLRRLTAAPQIYLRTVDDQGHAIDAATLDMVEQTIRQMAPVWSAGAFGVAGVTRGTDTKEGTPGWLTVKWMDSLDACGRTTVAQSGGVMELNPSAQKGCASGTAYAVSPTIVAHETGHAFGFWHTDSPNDLMYGGTLVEGRQPSARERLAAKVVYARPVGNTDPDDDPSSAVQLHAVRIP